jgi:hypothetical protein
MVGVASQTFFLNGSNLIALTSYITSIVHLQRTVPEARSRSVRGVVHRIAGYVPPTDRAVSPGFDTFFQRFNHPFSVLFSPKG